MRIFIKLLVNTISIVVASYILPGVKVADLTTALVVAVLLGLANITIKPLLLIFTLPITILTLGLFTLIINGLIVLLVSLFVPGFVVTSLWWAILFSLVVSLVGWFLNSMASS